jgi:hypothetical protein
LNPGSYQRIVRINNFLNAQKCDRFLKVGSTWNWDETIHRDSKEFGPTAAVPQHPASAEA